MLVPLPEVYVAYSVGVVFNWISGVPVTVTGPVKLTVIDTDLPALYAPVGVVVDTELTVGLLIENVDDVTEFPPTPAPFVALATTTQLLPTMDDRLLLPQ